MSAWAGWEKDVLALLHAPASTANIRFLDQWHQYEQSNCQNNPLNTTLVYGSSARCNSAGVQSYFSATIGAQATARTLTNGFYNAIVAALRSGDPFHYGNPQAVAAQITKWGTPNFAALYLGEVGAAPPPPPPPPVSPPGSVPPGSRAPGAHNAWGQVRWAVNHVLPQGLQQAQRYRRAALHMIGRKRR